jgi:hypothetical protein
MCLVYSSLASTEQHEQYILLQSYQFTRSRFVLVNFAVYWHFRGLVSVKE